MNKAISATLLLFILKICSVNLFGQTSFININPGDSESEIIQKATQVVPSERQLQWQNLELTAFVHFGMNTFTGREWGTGKENPAIFNPSNLDTDQWISILKTAGFKQVILTAKHHDGFCLWPTETTAHSVKNSPWKNGKGDIVKEMAESCKKYGIGFGIYLSPWDMNADSYGSPAYNDFFVKQLTELLTQYGKINEVWFDGANGEGKNGLKQVYDFNRWYKLIRKLQPEAVIAIMGPDVRWVGTETGKGRSQEWSVIPADHLNQEKIAGLSQKEIIFSPAKDLTEEVLGDRKKIFQAKALVWYPAETDVSLMDGWFYHEKHKIKSAKTLNDIYFTSVGMNSVLLLNVPPDKRGIFNDETVKTLKEWAKMREEIFKKNVLEGSKGYSKSFRKIKNLIDGDNFTSARAKNTSQFYSVEFKLRKKTPFNVLQLQEDITKGQRIEKFAAYYLNGNKWTKFAEGTTVGHKRLLRTETLNTSRIRFDIEQSRLEPYLSEIGLYFEKDRLNDQQ